MIDQNESSNNRIFDGRETWVCGKVILKAANPMLEAEWSRRLLTANVKTVDLNSP